MLGTIAQPKGEALKLQAFANGVAEEYMDVVTTGMAGHERSLQKLIGPSEIGVPCNRALIHKIAQTPEPDRGPAWKPQMGTFAHAGMEEWFKAPSPKARTTAADWEVEQKVAVGTIGPDTIKGSTDLWFDGGAVIDHKFVGKTRLQVYRRSGPGPQYRVQAHTYGKGWEDEGYGPQIVMIAFLPRDGELRDAYFWWEPYDRTVAEQALARANNRWELIQNFGLQGALDLFPLCDASINKDWEWCGYCNPLRQTAAAAANTRPFAVNN